MTLMTSLQKNSKIFMIIGLIILGSVIYFTGRSNGYSACKAEWDKYIQENIELNNKLQKKFLEEKDKLIEENFRLSQDILNHEQEYNTNLNNIKSEYSDRLRQSEQRALHYQSMSTKTNGERCSTADLANHTARLDRQLTEGINLVRELRELIKFRDNQLRQCGNQIRLLVQE